MRNEATQTKAARTRTGTRWGSPAVTTGAMLLAIIAFYVLREHWSHVAGAWPYLLLLACPLMHVFMHRRHAHHDGQ